MERLSGLLLKVWRQVSCHVKLEESLPRIGPTLRERLPAELIAVLRVDRGNQRLEAIAATDRPEEKGSFLRHRGLAEKELEDLLAWGRAATL